METLVIYTIGHSDHTIEAFVDLLAQHGITLVIDVRSQPYSRWAPQFNRETLSHDLEDTGVAYRFMGDLLGGRPSDPELYRDGQPDYRVMETSEAYQRGMNALLKLASSHRVALMCGEADYLECHRNLLISQTLLKRGVDVFHVKPDGSLIEGELVLEQLSLF